MSTIDRSVWAASVMKNARCDEEEAFLARHMTTILDELAACIAAADIDGAHAIGVRWRKRFKKYFRRRHRKIAVGLRFQILARDGFRCVYCGLAPCDGVELHVDHIVPLSAGGPSTHENLRTACSECNIGKSDRMLVYA